MNRKYGSDLFVQLIWFAFFRLLCSSFYTSSQLTINHNKKCRSSYNNSYSVFHYSLFDYVENLLRKFGNGFRYAIQRNHWFMLELQNQILYSYCFLFIELLMWDRKRLKAYRIHCLLLTDERELEIGSVFQWAKSLW